MGLLVLTFNFLLVLMPHAHCPLPIAHQQICSRFFRISYYIDSWFEALIAGIEAIAVGKKLTVDVVEEPEPLIFEPGDGTMKILYQGQAPKINDIDEVVDSLKKSARTLIEKLNGLTGMERNP